MKLLSLFRREPERVLTKVKYDELLDQVEGLARSQKAIRVEWEETFERIERLLKRLNGVLAASRKADQQELEEEVEPRKSVAPEPFQRYATSGELQSHRQRRFGGLLR